jgi:hypothetical protein
VSARATTVDRSASSSPIARRTKVAGVVGKVKERDSGTRGAFEGPPGDLTIAAAGRTKLPHHQPLGRYT